MPIPKPSSILNLIHRFESHWEMVNAHLSPHPALTVLELRPIGTLDGLRQRILDAEAVLARMATVSRERRGEVQGVKQRLLMMVREFNVMMRAFYTGTPLTRLLTEVGTATGSVWTFYPLVWETEFVWEKVAALPPELQRRAPVLRDGTTLARFLEEFAALREVQGVWDAAAFEARLAQGEIEVVRAEVVAVATAYRHAVLGRLPEKDRLRRSLPELWHPGAPGRGRQG